MSLKARLFDFQYQQLPKFELKIIRLIIEYDNNAIIESSSNNDCDDVFDDDDSETYDDG